MMPPDPLQAAGPAPKALDGQAIYTVSELTRRIRDILEQSLGRVWVAGEISNLRRPASGHAYFTLKDELAQLNVVMWRSTAATLKFELKDGLAVLLQGELTVYESRGQYQIVARRLQPRGLGALQLAFMQLKEKLAREGLFEPERKRPLPLIPRRIAIITSPTGAAVRDILNVITRRYPPADIIICPVAVQGDSAPPQIVSMLERAGRLPRTDVIVLTRGGGSIEDLWPFNEESVARAIADSPIPVVSAVGHETDFTIADFVADVRALTPTDAGVRVVPDTTQLVDTLAAAARRLAQSLLRRTSVSREHLDALARSYALRRPLDPIRAAEQRLDELAQRLVRGVTNGLRSQRRRFDAAVARLDSLSPLAVLARGYSITLRRQTPVRDAATLKPGHIVHTHLHKGSFRASVLPHKPAARKKPSKPRKRRSKNGSSQG